MTDEEALQIVQRGNQEEEGDFRWLEAWNRLLNMVVVLQAENAKLKGYLSDRIQDTDFVRYACDTARAEGVREGRVQMRADIVDGILMKIRHDLQHDADRAMGDNRALFTFGAGTVDIAMQDIAALPDVPVKEEASA